MNAARKAWLERYHAARFEPGDVRRWTPEIAPAHEPAYLRGRDTLARPLANRALTNAREHPCFAVRLIASRAHSALVWEWSTVAERGVW